MAALARGNPPWHEGLATRQNFAIINADALGHEVLTQENVKKQIKNRFGEGVFNHCGEIDRSKLAQFVFGSSSESRTARDDLNRIVHPNIGKRIHQEINQAQELAQREPGSVRGVLLDAAILLETGWAEMCDAIVFVEASDEVRERRVRETRGWSTADWKKREQSQLDFKRKAKSRPTSLFTIPTI